MEIIKNIDLNKRILEIAFHNRLSHLGSYFSSVKIIDRIYSQMKTDDVFILSSGHASLAQYVCIEKYYGIDALYLFNKHGGHPNLDEDNKIYCSTGSLGLGLPFALGRSLANQDKDYYVLISDGECSEGSIWESLSLIKQLNIQNIHVYVNINGFCAYDRVDTEYLSLRLKAFLPSINLEYTSVEEYHFLKGLNAHYHIMSKEDFESVI